MSIEPSGLTPVPPTSSAGPRPAARGSAAPGTLTIDGNEAAARIAYRLSEVIAIYPITPSSPMAELADQWASERRPNLWGSVPLVVQMQSEGGAAGTVHGALQSGALSTSFTSSQGLLLMLPNMFKIAGELTPAVLHVAARTVATHALSIFGDHSDVMAARATGWAMLASASVQEALDLALVAHASTLAARIPFVHFFDGFRTSHEVAKIANPSDEVVRALIDDELVRAHRARSLSPDHPVLRGSAQNPDVFFQAREAGNPYYRDCADIVQHGMDRLAALTGRRYRLFDAFGHPQAERVIVAMGSGAEAVRAACERLVERGERVGLVQVRLFRPFSAELFVRALPPSVRAIAVLDRTKEPGAPGEPLYQDVATAIGEALQREPGAGGLAARPTIVGGRYGLSSKEFTPAMAEAVYAELARARPRNHFAVGIEDDVTGASLPYDRSIDGEDPQTLRCLFYGLGSDGTVGANKSSIKIIGERTSLHAQGYFVYDSKKSGSTTVSHLRFGPRPIRAPWLIGSATFVACHQPSLLERVDVLAAAAHGATFLLNAPGDPAEIWQRLPGRIQRRILEKGMRVFAIDAAAAATELGLGRRINTIMQTCFFALSGVLPETEAVAAVRRSIEKSYAARGRAVIEKNLRAVDEALRRLRAVPVPRDAVPRADEPERPPEDAPRFVREVTAEMLAGRGDELPVSAFPPDGTFPTGTARFEKRGLAAEIPVWDAALCIQCGKCAMVCPHAAIREKVYPDERLADAPSGFLSTPARWKQFAGQRYTLQVAPDDCTGCGLCVVICPAEDPDQRARKALVSAALAPLRERERASWKFFLGLPETDREALSLRTVKDAALLRPLFEFSGACVGCGETPYVRLLSQLFGDRALIANATGCSSIFGGNLPTTPWAADASGRGPAWANSLFEDNAEFGLGFRLALDAQGEHARALLERLSRPRGPVERELAAALLEADQGSERGIRQQRERVRVLRAALAAPETSEERDLFGLADALVRKSVWIVGGDGWAYDIGFGGLDHVLASGHDVNVLVLDTEVYSNTGGQSSKATPRAAVARFAAGGKDRPKKDLGMLAIGYGDVYVAQVAMGANDAQSLRALAEAEAWRGPSLILAYSPCVAHGYDMACGIDQQRRAVQSGYWPLYRYDPARKAERKNPFQLDSKAPSLPLDDYLASEQRFRSLRDAAPERAARLASALKQDVSERWQRYERMSRAES